MNGGRIGKSEIIVSILFVAVLDVGRPVQQHIHAAVFQERYAFSFE